MSWRVVRRACVSHHSGDGHVSSNWIHQSNTLGLKSSVADAESAAITGDTTLVLGGGGITQEQVTPVTTGGNQSTSRTKSLALPPERLCL